jgi:hypothetical protein
MNDDTFPMFDLNLMDFFYNPKYENDENVINAWYIYVMKILPIVSKKWRDSITPDKLSNEKSMFSFITISDEALMRWLLIIWVSNLTKKKSEQLTKKSDQSSNNNSDKENEDNMIYSKTNNQDDDSKPSKRKRGPHDTNAKLNIYTKLFHEIKTARSDYNTAVRWNLIFWNEVRKRNAYLLEGDSVSLKRQSYFDYASDLPLPDLNENQEFLASYSISTSNNSDKMSNESKNDGQFVPV